MSTILVKNFSSDVNQETLIGVFGQFGNIESCNIVKDCSEDSKRHAYIVFKEGESAEKAIQNFNEKEALGASNLYVAAAKSKGGQGCFGPGNIFIKNLESEIGEKYLQETFSVFGEIVSLKILKDDADKSEGRAFICYGSVEDAIRAIAVMNKRVIGSNTIAVEFAKCRNAQDRLIRESHIKKLMESEALVCSDIQLDTLSIASSKEKTATRKNRKWKENSKAKKEKKIDQRKYRRFSRNTSHCSKDSSSENNIACAIVQNDSSSGSSSDESYDICEKSSSKFKNELFSNTFYTLGEEKQKELLYELLLPQIELLYPNIGDEVLKILILMKNSELMKMFEDSTLLKARCGGVVNVIKLSGSKVFNSKRI